MVNEHVYVFQKTKMNNELIEKSVSKGSINKNLSTGKNGKSPLVEGLRVERNNFLLDLLNHYI